MRLALLALPFVAFVGGCATPATAPSGPLPGISVYYDQATRPQRRDVRKPIRDARARALRALAQRSEAALAERPVWEHEVDLDRLAPADRAAAQAALSDFGAALRDLAAAAARQDIPEVRAAYRRAVAARTTVADLARTGS